jgi:mannose-6-phosphate isomerase-like protein (cupin superfamily)
MMVTKINLADKFVRFQEHWKPKIIGEINESYLKLVKVKGEFIWHQHAAEDELFLVVKGRLLIKLRDGEVWLEPGELTIVPRGVEHCPVAEDEVQIILLEPKSTLNTGDVQNERTVPQPEWV